MAEMVVVGFTQKGQTGRNTISDPETEGGCMWKFYFTLWFCKNAGVARAQKESGDRSMRPDLSPSRAGRRLRLTQSSCLSVPDIIGQWAMLWSHQQTHAPPWASSLHCALICTGRNSYITALKCWIPSALWLTGWEKNLSERWIWSRSVWLWVFFLSLQWTHSFAWINTSLSVEIFLFLLLT